MLVFEEMRWLIGLLKKLLTKNLYSKSLALFRPKPLNCQIHQVWQNEWDGTVIASNKLHEILPKLLDRLLPFCKARNEDQVVNRLHIHSYLMHSFILKGEVPPVCVEGNTLITIKYILIECADLLAVRKK